MFNIRVLYVFFMYKKYLGTYFYETEIISFKFVNVNYFQSF